ncbi:response regulator transcription factor [Clostridium hydrogenum]|uniref:response regulator transcription factor n=1 Tax=Clostridium hydrogenum TaxID=2855764 RepID=UPI001F3D6656|nr:response regulator transcription factor [Clostridium hydrogenum]
MNENILIIDDDKDIGDMLMNYFSKEGYTTKYACNGKEGLQLFKQAFFSLILLDIMMPEMDGYTMLRKLRELSDVPVILLTAKGEQMDKINGFIKGCDDYVVKPFDFTELSLRISVILKRSSKKASSSSIINIKDIEINSEEYTVKKAGKEINLTAKEYDILHTLASNKGRLYSSQMLYELIWKDPFIENDNTVTMHIKNLRDKLGDSVKNSRYIKTIWGMGYKIEKDT